MSENDFLRVEANDCPMSSCAAPAGSPCRTGRGRVAAQYHTARFRLVPQLAKALSVPVPPVRRPGSAWTELPRPPAAGAAPTGRVRIGYARASTVRQSLDTQAGSLHAAGVTRIFAEKISTRAVTRPRLDKAVALASEMRTSGVAVTIVGHEQKRLGRGIELAALAEQLRAAGLRRRRVPADVHLRVARGIRRDRDRPHDTHRDPTKERARSPYPGSSPGDDPATWARDNHVSPRRRS